MTKIEDANGNDLSHFDWVIDNDGNVSRIESMEKTKDGNWLLSLEGMNEARIVTTSDKVLKIADYAVTRCFRYTDVKGWCENLFIALGDIPTYSQGAEIIIQIIEDMQSLIRRLYELDEGAWGTRLQKSFSDDDD